MNELLQQIAPLFKEMRPEEQQAVLKALHADDGEAQLRQIMAARTAQAGVPKRRTLVDADFTGELSDFAKVSPEAMGRPRPTLDQPVSSNGQGNVDIPTAMDPELYQVMPELVDPIQSVPGFEGGAPQFKDSTTLRIAQGVLGGVSALSAALGGGGLAAAASGGAGKAEQIRAQRYAQFVGDMDAYRQAMSNQIQANKRIEIANARQVQDAREQSIDNYWNAIEESRRQATAESERAKREVDTRIAEREATALETAWATDPAVMTQGIIDEYRLHSEKIKSEQSDQKAKEALARFRDTRSTAFQELSDAHKRRATVLQNEAIELEGNMAEKVRPFMARNPKASGEELQAMIEQAASDSTDANHRRAIQYLDWQKKLAEKQKELLDLRGYDQAGRTRVPGDSVKADPMDSLIEGIIGGDPAINVETQLESDEYGEDLRVLDQFMR